MDRRIREMCLEIDRQKKLRDAQGGVTEWAEKLLDENERLTEELADCIREMRRAQEKMLSEYGVGIINPQLLAKYQDS